MVRFGWWWQKAATAAAATTKTVPRSSRPGPGHHPSGTETHCRCRDCGFPNAGKSTLISKISKVRSKIASYPFTTRQPILGVVETDDHFHFVVADLPGLIEGAHAGRGLGDRFLKHAERTKILLHLIDMAGSEDRDPLDDYEKIENELMLYSDQLTLKKRFVVANKMDLPEAARNLRRFKRKYGKDIISISALEGKGLESLVEKMKDILVHDTPIPPSC